VDQEVANLNDVFIIIELLDLPIRISYVARTGELATFLLNRIEYNPGRSSINHEGI
jgi:hypothetical protein